MRDKMGNQISTEKQGHRKKKISDGMPALPDGTTIAPTDITGFMPRNLHYGCVPHHIKLKENKFGTNTDDIPGEQQDCINSTSTSTSSQTYLTRGASHKDVIIYRASSSPTFTKNLSSIVTDDRDFFSKTNTNDIINMDDGILRKDSSRRVVTKSVDEQQSTSKSNPGCVVCSREENQFLQNNCRIHGTVSEEKTQSTSSGNSVKIDVRSSLAGTHKEQRLTIEVNTRDDRDSDDDGSDHANSPFPVHVQERQRDYNCHVEGDAVAIDADEPVSEVGSADSGQESMPGYRSRSVTDLGRDAVEDDDKNNKGTWQVSMTSKEDVLVSGHQISANENDVALNFTRRGMTDSSIPEQRHNGTKCAASPPPSQQKKSLSHNVEAVNEKLRQHRQNLPNNTCRQNNDSKMKNRQITDVLKHVFDGRESYSNASSTDFENQPSSRLGSANRRVHLRHDGKQRREGKTTLHQFSANPVDSPKHYPTIPSLPAPVTINGNNNQITINYNIYGSTPTPPTPDCSTGNIHQRETPVKRFSVTLNGAEVPTTDLNMDTTNNMGETTQL